MRKKSAAVAVINDETTVVTQMSCALIRRLLVALIFGCIRVLYMRETTAEIWIGQAEGSDWMGTQGGLNASHLLLLRENSRPAWMLMPGNLYDKKPPQLDRPKVWVPSHLHPLEDALLLFTVMGAKVPEVRAVLGEFEKSRNRTRLDINALFPKGFPRQVYEANQKHLKGWHVVVSACNGSLAKKDLDALKKYKSIDVDVRETTSFQRRDLD